MHEVSGLPMAPLPRHTHLLEPLERWAREEPDHAMASVRRGDTFEPVTAGEVHRRVRALARGLIARGVRPGDRVALMSRTRLEWMVVDHAIVATGAVTVPIYETSSQEQVQWILSDSGAVLAVVETPEMATLVDRVAPVASTCRERFVIDEGGLDELAAAGDGVDDEEVDRRIAAITGDQLATIVYTSGTTGRPKGCMLTHANLRTNVVQNLETIRPMLTDDEVSLVFLPLAHALTKIIALVGLEWGVTLAFATDLAHLQEELPMVRPTMVIAVPRVFEKVYNGAQHKASKEGHGAVFAKAEEVSVCWSRKHAEGHRGLVTDVEHALLDRVVYRKLHEVFGGRMRFAFSGGGPLGERLTHFFNGIGVQVFEGYGLTETSPTLTLNRSDAWRPGTVGRPLPGTTIRLAGDGEVLARGPQVFQGYWRNEAATAEVLDEEGWFHTGDIGELDDEGYLRITGRKKELIVTAAGKNVAPAPLEDRLRAHALVSQAVVVGDQLPFVAAVLALDEEAVTEWAAERELSHLSLAELAADDALLAVLQEAVDDANRSVSKAESIRKFAVLPRDLTIADGELTPTLKVRRAVVAKAYGSVIEGLYA